VAEQRPFKPLVVGSTPTAPTNIPFPHCELHTANKYELLRDRSATERAKRCVRPRLNRGQICQVCLAGLRVCGTEHAELGGGNTHGRSAGDYC
jgi:hypothetical protein